MPHNPAKIKTLSNNELYDLNVDFSVDPPVLKATLTDEAKKLGVRFDPVRADNTLNLAKTLGYDTDPKSLQLSPGSVIIDRTDPSKRVLRNDKSQLVNGSGKGKRINFKLDRRLGLIDYVHPQTQEIYYKLSPKEPERDRRTLVLCFDGTSNQFSSQNTNVVKLVDLLKKDHPERQLVYYQPGVGTYVSNQWSGSLMKPIATKADEGLATYLYQHIIDGYKYLVEAYQAGDRICIFGFSRGAFTARALAGMIHCVGLLSRDNVEHIQFAYEIYESQLSKTSDDPTATKNPEDVRDGFDGVEQLGALGIRNSKYAELAGARAVQGKANRVNPEAYKRTFCISVKIDFVGVWDTVASVGSLLPKTLAFIDYNPSIRIFRHALALDETRGNFLPSLWDHSQTRTEDNLKFDVYKQDVREVWFRGEHSDIGGGADRPQTEDDGCPFTQLSNIALRWMVQQCFDCKTGIIFDQDTMRVYRQLKVLEPRAPPDTKDTLSDDYLAKLWQGSTDLDKTDVKHKPYDSKGWSLGWAALELYPGGHVVQNEKGAEVSHVPNAWSPRKVYRRQGALGEKDKIYMHSSVVDFLATPDGKDYVPRTIWLGFDKADPPKISTCSDANPAWPDVSFKALQTKETSWAEGAANTASSLGSKILSVFKRS